MVMREGQTLKGESDRNTRSNHKENREKDKERNENLKNARVSGKGRHRKGKDQRRSCQCNTERGRSSARRVQKHFQVPKRRTHAISSKKNQIKNVLTTA